MPPFHSPVNFLGSSYSDSNDLTSDIDSEIAFCNNIPKHFNPTNYEAFLNSLKRKVTEFENHVTTAESQKAPNINDISNNKTREINQEISNRYSQIKPPFNHKSQEGRIVSEIANGKGNRGKGAYLGLSSQNFNKIEDPLCSDLISGLIAVSEYKSNITIELSTLIQKLLSDTDEKTKKFAEQSTSLSNQIEDLKKKSSELLSSQSEEFRKHSDEITKKVNETLSKSQKKLEEREKVLAEKLRLNASVKYWRDRKESAWWFMGLSSGVAALTPPIIMGIFYLTFNKTLPEALRIMVRSSHNGIPNLAYSSIFIVCSVLMFYSISSFFKLIFNQVNIVNLCMENITKAQYYLALVNEEAIGKDDKEIKSMMLKSIFESKHPHLSAGNALDSLPIKQVFQNGKE